MKDTEELLEYKPLYRFVACIERLERSEMSFLIYKKKEEILFHSIWIGCAVCSFTLIKYGVKQLWTLKYRTNKYRQNNNIHCILYRIAKTTASHVSKNENHLHALHSSNDTMMHLNLSIDTALSFCFLFHTHTHILHTLITVCLFPFFIMFADLTFFVALNESAT